MIDAALQKWTGPLFARAARRVREGVSANALLVAGFVIGLGAMPAIARHYYYAGLALILANRLLSGLGSAVARRTMQPGVETFLDATLDGIFFASIPFAFALGDPSRALAAAFLLFGFVANTAAEIRGRASLSPLGRLIERGEAVIAFALACLLPQWFSVIAYVFGVACFISAGARFASAAQGTRAP